MVVYILKIFFWLVYSMTALCLHGEERNLTCLLFIWNRRVHCAIAWIWRSEDSLQESVCLLPACEFQVSKSGCLAQWQMTLPTKQSCIRPPILLEQDLTLNQVKNSFNLNYFTSWKALPLNTIILGFMVSTQKFGKNIVQTLAE